VTDSRGHWMRPGGRGPRPQVAVTGTASGWAKTAQAKPKCLLATKWNASEVPSKVFMLYAAKLRCF
jgi:hypothetical protein